VTILGAILLFSTPTGPGLKIFGAFGLIMAAFNLVGGFIITDRMVRMFKTHKNDGLK